HQLQIAADDRVGLLLEWQQDVDADALFPTGADVAGLHDAAGRSGDDHPAGLGDAAAELLRSWGSGMAGRQTRRAEDRHLAHTAVGRENLEGVTQLLERGAEQFHVAAAGPVANELVSRLAHLLHELLDARWLAVLGVSVI